MDAGRVASGFGRTTFPPGALVGSGSSSTIQGDVDALAHPRSSDTMNGNGLLRLKKLFEVHVSAKMVDVRLPKAGKQRHPLSKSVATVFCFQVYFSLEVPVHHHDCREGRPGAVRDQSVPPST
ncbi:hypothetical protein MUK42_13643 [Musa troglodytarum]|uniref:Uncharacterized protein n=1 Tax=Musa troglodytarum TaxID=320322 RepID=A0A9E7IAQ5_9LILI|nr:hypothetical protein MUK42_13643 [Musa troglodytarum]